MDLGLFSCWRLAVEWTSLASFVRSLLEFHGNLANGGVSLCPSLSLSMNLSCARLASRICSFVLLASSGHFLGSGRTSFRFSAHCVLPRLLRSLAENAKLHSRARAGTGPDYPYLFLRHARTYRCLLLPRYAAFPTCRMARGIFALKYTRQNSRFIRRLTRRIYWQFCKISSKIKSV